MAISARELTARRGGFGLDVPRFSAGTDGVALLGRNGAGKSTLLLALQGLIAHTGSVERPSPSAGVFAQPAVLRGSVLWNVVVIALGAAAGDERAIRPRAEELLAAVGLADAKSSDARQLSSGERQRLALARALVLQPRALFLDEPFANVDADGRPALRSLVRDYVARSGCSLVLATQNLADATALCASAVLLEKGKPVEVLDVAAIAASRSPYLQALVTESLPQTVQPEK